MVFSFFKKQPQKMPEKPAARPRPPVVDAPVKAPPAPEPAPVALEPLPDLEFSTGHLPPPRATAKPAEKPAAPMTQSRPFGGLIPDIGADDFGGEFTESSVMAIDVEHDIDPVQSDIEQAVVLFANGQDAAARSLLETFIRTYPGVEGLRFWRLLFDVLQVTGDRPAFEQLGMRFAETCEMSPPTWIEFSEPATRVPAGTRRIVLQGVLAAGTSGALAELGQAIAARESLFVDCGRLLGCDDEVAGQLAVLLQHARCGGLSLVLENSAPFLQRLNDRLVVGKAEHAPAWLLLLELLQHLGTQAQFEERAVDYAVTFELSPPSWESCPVPQARTGLAAKPAERPDDACYLSGELKSQRFEALGDYLENTQNPVIDCAGVRRIDFFSAGQLVNRIAPFKAVGKEVVIRSPSHLVAELMAVVGLNKQARIIVPKS